MGVMIKRCVKSIERFEVDILAPLLAKKILCIKCY